MVVFPDPDSPLFELVSNCQMLHIMFMGEYRVQEENGLVFRAMAESDVGPFCHILGAALGARFFGAISLGRTGCVIVDRNERVGREPRDGQRDMEATRQVCRQVRVGLEVSR